MTTEAVTAGPSVTLAADYSTTGAHWQHGPARIYDRLAEVVIERSPVPVSGASVLDVGAGTGAASRAASARGARCVLAADASLGMLQVDARDRPPSAVADARSLPFPNRRFDLAVAAFSLNHLADPARAAEELARVVRPGGAVVTASYASDDTHPVKQAVEAALSEIGWHPPSWYRWMREETVPQMASAPAVADILAGSGLTSVSADVLRVSFDDLDPMALVRWRLGMAQHAPFVAGLDDRSRRRLEDDACDRLGSGAPTLVRSIVVGTARAARRDEGAT